MATTAPAGEVAGAVVVDDDGVVVGVDDGRVVVVDRLWPPADGEEDAGVEEAGSVEVVVDGDGEEDGAVGSGEEPPAGAVLVVVVDGSTVEGSTVDGPVVEGSTVEGSVEGSTDGPVVTVDGSVVTVVGSGAGSVTGMVSVVVGSIPAPGSVGEPVSATA